MKKVFAVIAVVSSVLVGVDAKAAEATATASLLGTLNIDKTANLQFGSFSKNYYPIDGNVTIAANGSRDAGSVAMLPLTAFGAASFTISGDATRTYAVTLPTTATLTHTNATDTMTVGNFVSSASRTIGAGGTDTLNVGARLEVPAAQAVGYYSGTFSVSVAYN